MRRLVEPASCTHCAVCGGELLMKAIEPDISNSDRDVYVYHCAKCGHDHSLTVVRDRYVANSIGASADLNRCR